ncbi:MAG: hypothetical protein GY754_09265, partial [bacterium]|nr:hypothetical protein [bacterium]
NRVEYHTFNIIKNVRIRNEDELIQAFDKKNKIEIVPQYHTYPEGLLKKYWMEQLGMI